MNQSCVMRHRFCITLLLGMVCGFDVMAKPPKGVLRPAGPKMCEYTCKRMVGCGQYAYKVSDMSCHTTDKEITMNDPAQGIYLFKAAKVHVKYEDKQMKCQKKSLMFYTRRNHLICRRRCSKEKRQDKISSLLLLPQTWVDNKGPIHQLFLHNRSVVPFPGGHKTRFTGAAVIPDTKQLVVASEDPDELSFVSLSNGDRMIIKSDMNIGVITVDAINKLIFFVNNFPLSLFSTHFTMYTGFTRIASLSGMAVESIVASPKRACIYFTERTQANNFNIQMKPYSEEHIYTLVENCHVKGNLCLDLQKDVIYYMEGGPTGVTLVQMIIEDKTVVKYLKLTFDAELLYLSGNTFYLMLVPFQGDLIGLTKGDNRTFSTGFSEYISKLHICGIP